MEFEQVKQQLKTDLSKLAQTDKLLLALAKEMYVLQSERIFNDGVLTDGSKIKYKTGSILVGSSSFAKKAAAKKFFSKSNKKSIEDKWVTLPSGARLVSLDGGFKALKKLNGKENPFDYTGQLKKSFFYEGRKGEAVVGFLNTKRLTPDGKQTSTTHEEIREGLEETKGTIFQMTKDEEKQVDVILNDYLDTIFK